MIKLAILGSTKGTDLQAIIEAIKNGKLDAKIEIVISNKVDAYILERAKNHKIKSIFIDPSLPDGAKQSREEYDQKLINKLSNHQIDLILLIGWMRIFSSVFINQYRGRIINVHPSLLPAFAGGMDLDVHEEVIKSDAKETGCTVHLVDEGVDTGKILVQKKYFVESTDTPETLKNKVQKLEGEALIESIRSFNFKFPINDKI